MASEEPVTIEFELGGIEYVGEVPDVVATKHLRFPILEAQRAKRSLPTAAGMSLALAALGMVMARAYRKGTTPPKDFGVPNYGTIRTHGFCPFTLGDAVERHFVLTQNVDVNSVYAAAQKCWRAVLGLPDEADVAETLDDAVGNSERTPTSDDASSSGSETAETPSPT